MAVTFTAQEKALGKAMGLKDVNSQADKDQIAAFAKANGVNNVNSQGDLDKLLPKVQTPKETSPGSNVWVNPNDLVKGGSYAGAPVAKPASPTSIPSAATDGSSSNSAFESLMMSLNQQLAEQQTTFQMQQQQAMQAAQVQNAEMAKMMAEALKPMEPTKTPDSASGWKDAGPEAKSQIESLLMASPAASSGSSIVGGVTDKAKDLSALLIA